MKKLLIILSLAVATFLQAEPLGLQYERTNNSVLKTNLTFKNITVTDSMTLGGQSRSNWPSAGSTGGITNAAGIAAAGGVINGQTNVAFINQGVGVSPFRFGAVGDGDVFTNITMTAASKTLTIVGGSQKYGRTFTQADVGKSILVYGAGFVTQGTTNCLSSIITNVASGTVCTLSNAALNSCTGIKVYAVYGTDDTLAIQAWLNYTTNFFGDGETNDMQLDVPSKIFVLSGPIIDPYSSATFVLHKNSQLQLPDYPIVGDFTKTLEIHGHIQPAPHEASSGVSSLGSIFWSFYVNTNVLPIVTSASGGALQQNVIQPAILTSQNWSNPVFTGVGVDNYTNKFNPIRLKLKNLTFRTGANPSISALDLSGCVNVQVESVHVDTGVRFDAGWKPINTNVFALKLPTTFADNNSDIDMFEANSFYTGIELGEHIHIKSCNLQGEIIAFMCRNGGHWTVIDNADPEGSKTVFYNPGGLFGLKANITIEGDNGNNASTYFSPVTIINDWNNTFYGEVDVDDTASSHAWDADGFAATSKVGGAFVKLIRYTIINGQTLPLDVYETGEVWHGFLDARGGLISTNNPIRTKNLTLDYGGVISAATVPGGSGFNFLQVDVSTVTPYLDSGGAGTVSFNALSGLGQNFYGAGIQWGWGRSDGLHLSPGKTITGDGQSLTNVTPGNIAKGNLPATVTNTAPVNATNITIGTIQDAQLASTFLKTIPVGATNGFVATNDSRALNLSSSANVFNGSSATISNIAVAYVRYPLININGQGPANDTLPSPFNNSGYYMFQFPGKSVIFNIDHQPFVRSGFTNLTCAFSVLVTNINAVLNGNFTMLALTNGVGAGGTAGGYRVDLIGQILPCTTSNNVYVWPVNFAVPYGIVTNIANLSFAIYNNGSTNWWLTTGSVLTNRP